VERAILVWPASFPVSLQVIARIPPSIPSISPTRRPPILPKTLTTEKARMMAPHRWFSEGRLKNITEPTVTIIPEANPRVARTGAKPIIQVIVIPPIMLVIMPIPPIPFIIVVGLPSANMNMTTDPSKMKIPPTRPRTKAATGFAATLVLFKLLKVRILPESFVHP